MMKRWLYVGLFVAAVSCVEVSGQAGQIDFLSTMNTQMTNMINTKRTEILSGISSGRGAGERAIEAAGAAKIRAGRATTKFTPSVAGSNAVATSLNYTGNLANDRAVQLRYVKDLVGKFNAQMPAYGFAVNDTVDGYVLAYALSFEAYYDQKTTPADLQTMRQKYRQYYQTNAYYQGLPDAKKQEVYERDAVLAMEAINYRNKARQAQSILERNDAEDGAVKLAKYNLRDDIDRTRGETLIKMGKASANFDRADKMLLANKYATSDYAYLKKDATYFENLLQTFDAEMKKYGGKTNDAADVNALAMALNYYIYSDGKVKFNQQQFAWAQDEMRKDVLASGQYQALTNQGKQEYYEYLAIKAMTTMEAFAESQKFLQRISPDLRSAYKLGGTTPYGTAYRNLKDIFSPRNFDDYQLTPTGFVKKR